MIPGRLFVVAWCAAVGIMCIVSSAIQYETVPAKRHTSLFPFVYGVALLWISLLVYHTSAP